MRGNGWFVVLLAGLSLALSASGPAAAQPEVLSLQGDRFLVEAIWQDFSGNTGKGKAVELTDDTGYFWFFDRNNVEVVVKVLDACAEPFNRFWFFAGGLTSVEVSLKVTDLDSGEVKTYRNPSGQAFQPIQDTDAFATCAAERACRGQGTPGEVRATPRADYDLENLALHMGGGLTADPGIYNRLVADVAAIRAQEPAVAGIGFLGRLTHKTLLMTVTPEAKAQMQAGTYHAWDCLNAWYGVEDVEILSSFNIVFLHLRGVVNTNQIAPDYLALPGIQSAESDSACSAPLLPPTSICAQREGNTYHYFFVEGFGKTWYFTTLPGSVVQFQDVVPSGTQTAWRPRLVQCMQIVAPSC